MKQNNMPRRQILGLGAAAATLALVGKALKPALAHAADAAKITDKNILKEGQPANIANYCTAPEKQPNKVCPGAKDKPGKCETCLFFNKDNSLTEFNGKKYAKCQLLTDPTKPQYVAASAWCATYAPKA